jgi:hypothetical protein
MATAGDGGHIWPPRYSDPRIQAIIDTGTLTGVYKARGLEAALQEELSLTSNEYSLDDLWNRYKVSKSITDTGEPFSITLTSGAGLSEGGALDINGNPGWYDADIWLSGEGNSINDKSSNAVTMNLTGSVVADATMGVNGQYALCGAGGATWHANYLRTPTDASKYTTGTGDCTIMGWVYYDTSLTADDFFGIAGSGSNFDVADNWGLQVTNSNRQIAFFGSGSARINSGAGKPIAQNGWSHVAIIRSSGTWILYINGVNAGEWASAAELGTDNNYLEVFTGVNSSAFGDNADFPGCIDDFVFIKGTALYTTAFTPPRKTDIVDQNWDEVKLLLALDGVDAATTTTDASDSARAVTFVGDAQLDTAVKKFGTASVLLDETGDWLTCANHADFDLAAQEWTLETHVQFSRDPGAAPDNMTFFSKGDWTTTDKGILCDYYDGTARFLWTTDGSTGELKTAAWNPTNGVMYHVVYQRRGDLIEIFIDGVRILSTTLGASEDIFTSSGLFYIGAANLAGNAEVAGNMDNIRFTLGVARYPGTPFTPPTAAYPDSGPA